MTKLNQMEQVTGSGPACLFSTAELTPRALCSVLGSPVQEKYGLTAMSPSQDHSDDEGTGASFTGEAERAGTVWPAEGLLGLWGIYTFMCINS